MTELEELIQKIAEYILANSEKNPMKLGIERDQCLVMAQEIGSQIYQEVLALWKKKNNGNGEKKDEERIS